MVLLNIPVSCHQTPADHARPAPQKSAGAVLASAKLSALEHRQRIAFLSIALIAWVRTGMTEG